MSVDQVRLLAIYDEGSAGEFWRHRSLGDNSYLPQNCAFVNCFEKHHYHAANDLCFDVKVSSPQGATSMQTAKLRYNQKAWSHHITASILKTLQILWMQWSPLINLNLVKPRDPSTATCYPESFKKCCFYQRQDKRTTSSHNAASSEKFPRDFWRTAGSEVKDERGGGV